MKKLTLALLTTLSTLAMADDELISRPEVQEYIRTTAATHGFSEDLLTYALQNAQTKSNIIAILDRPSTSRPWHEFQANFVNKTRINNGAKFWRNHAELVEAVSKKYQVSPAVMLAILGSNGSIMAAGSLLASIPVIKWMLRGAASAKNAAIASPHCRLWPPSSQTPATGGNCRVSAPFAKRCIRAGQYAHSIAAA